ncbi:MAG: NAD-dependent dehydratase, partial [Armatimonadota bacterium]
TQEERTMLRFAEVVRAAVGSSSEIVHLPMPSDDPKQRRPDATRAGEVLGWRPDVSLEAGLAETIEAFRRDLAQGVAREGVA